MAEQLALLDPAADPLRVELVAGRLFEAAHKAAVDGLQRLSEEARRRGWPLRVELSFAAPLTIHRNRRQRFEAAQMTAYCWLNQAGAPCYTLRRPSGFRLSFEMITQLQQMRLVSPVPTSVQVAEMAKLANRLAPGAWEDLRVRLESEPAGVLASYGEPTVTNVTRKIPSYVAQALRQAFAARSDYRWEHRSHGVGNQGRTLRVETKLCEDGVFRAWFSSEYNGCANGDYWLLASPTTAILRERD